MIGVIIFLSSTRSLQPANAFGDEYMAAGIGTEFQVAISSSQVQVSVDSALQFEQKRDGFTRSDAVNQMLVDLESKTLEGHLRKVSSAEVGSCLAAAFQAKVATLNDTKIDETTNTSFWQYPALPYPPISGATSTQRPALLWPETDHLFLFGVAELAQAIKQYRDGSTAEALIWRGYTATEFGARIKAKLNEIQTSVNSWGSSDEITPTQAFILAYYLMAGDPLGGSQSHWTTFLQSLEDRWVNEYRIARQGNKKPFGDNGYIYRAPVSVYFDDATAIDFLGRLAEVASY